MELSTIIKERFCKDCNIPLKLFQEPYFMDRLKLYDPFFKTIEKWDIFVTELSKYHCEQDYLEEYNRVKDSAISSIKQSKAFQRFNEEDMNQYRIQNANLSNKDIFKMINDTRAFLSIDMRKANFSSLYYYSKEIFQNTLKTVNNWEDFIANFTKNKHIINSKYIRQVILGNCNPKRHITYEKYLMDNILTELLKKEYLFKENIVFFSNDEIIMDVSEKTEGHREEIKNLIEEEIKEGKTILSSIPLRIELFTLYRIHGTEGYYKKISNGNHTYHIEFKCLDNYILPFVIRKFLNEEITENDKIFYYEGRLAKLLEIPEINQEFFS